MYLWVSDDLHSGRLGMRKYQLNGGPDLYEHGLPMGDTQKE